MSSFVKEYSLFQQTPLIHFQYDQEGATLRATEVKPKLDRFIIAQMKKQGKPIPADWYIDKDDRGKAALNYKIWIFANCEPEKTREKEHQEALNEIDKQHCDRAIKKEKKKRLEAEYAQKLIHPLYFGNQGRENDQIASYKEAVFFQKPLTLKISCFVKGLLGTIETYLPLFFSVTNFGTRQSKGFGGFCFSETPAHRPSDERIMELIRSYGEPFLYCKIPPSVDVEKRRDIVLMNYAAAVYAIMKGGMNHTRYDVERGRYLNESGYIKGFIQRDYLDKKNLFHVGSDKVRIKKSVVKPLPGQVDRKPECVFYQSNNTTREFTRFAFVRAILGLADHYEFRDDIRGEKEVKIRHYCGTSVRWEENKPIVRFNEESLLTGRGIERFKSPITIKILDNSFVFLFNDSYQEILDQVFFFLSKEKEEEIDNLIKKIKNPNNSEPKEELMKRVKSLLVSGWISTPSTFSIQEFMRGFVCYFEKEKFKLQFMSKTTPFYCKRGNIDLFKLNIGGESRS